MCPFALFFLTKLLLGVAVFDGSIPFFKHSLKALKNIYKNKFLACVENMVEKKVCQKCIVNGDEFDRIKINDWEINSNFIFYLIVMINLHASVLFV